MGIPNTAISLTIALAALSNSTSAIPSALYSVSMYLFALMMGYLLTHKDNFSELVQEPN
jgi:predicted Na+-dependent transporter